MLILACLLLSTHSADLSMASTQLQTLSRDAVATEIPRAEGFILTGPLKRASDGSDSWTIGEGFYLGIAPGSPLIPSTKALEGVRVRVILERAP